MSKTDWLEKRRAYLGGTDIAAIVGMNRYKTPLAVALDKWGEISDTSGIKARMGTCLEPLVKELFAEETGKTVLPCREHILHEKYPFLGGNPDGLVAGDGILECKTYDYATESEWGEPGTDQIPKAYFIQANWYLGLAWASVCWVAALHRTSGKFSVYRVDFDQELYDMLVDEGVKFWNTYVIPKVNPEPTDGDIDTLREMYPTDTGESIVADWSMEKLAEKMRDAQDAMRPFKQEFETAKAQFIAKMGDAARCMTMLGEFTYRRSKDSSVTDWKAVQKAMLVPGADYAEIVAANTKTKNGSRRFITPFKED